MRWYVYALAYPDGRIFYVGKGREDRILDHEEEARRGGTSRKCEIIRDIWASGRQVERVKLAFFDTDEEALAYEAFLISSLDGLSNILEGRKRIREILLTQRDATDFGGYLRQWRDDSSMFWSAREVAEFFGYIDWRAFQQVIQRAKRVARLAGWDEQEHFQPTYKVVLIGMRNHRSIDDYQLSREAFWLVVQNADPSKFVVAFGKTVLALQNAILDSPQPPQGAEIPGSSKYLRTLKGWAAVEPIPVRNLPLGRGAMPEDLPTPTESIQQLERKEQQRLKHQGQPSLFELPPEE
jgi:hypothetical protein